MVEGLDTPFAAILAVRSKRGKMRRESLFPLVSILLCLTALSHAQLYSGVLPSSRATTAWTTAGVEGGIPSGSWTQCGATIAAGASASTINTALSNCTANHYVLLGPGAFNLSQGLYIGHSNVVLRGSGPDQTFIVASADAPNGCFVSGSFIGEIAMCAGSNTQHIVSWTAGYSQGATQITLSSVSGLTVGTPILLEQADDSSDGWPAAGDLYVCENTSNNCSNQGGGSGAFYPEANRSNMEIVRATAINQGGCGATCVTINPPITLPNYRSSQSPDAVYYNSGVFETYSGVENLSLDYSGGQSGIKMVYCDNCWVKNVRVINTISSGSGTVIYDIVPVLSFHITVRDSYIFGPTSASGAQTNYPLTQFWAGSVLWENNILQREEGAIVTDGPYSNSVFSYNFFPGRNGPGVVMHNAGEMMNLIEGNVMTGFYGDVVHGTHFMDTVFRNAMIGGRYSGGNTGQISEAVHIETNNRFMNVVGNVMGDSYFTSYEDNLGSNGTSIYSLGYQGSGSGTPVTSDSNVKRTIMRWGNWDSVTNAIRWCGNSSDTGWSATCSSTTEIPSGITNFSTPLPTLGDTGAGQSALPASFYYSSTPVWWPSGKAWPPIGPDVSGGNISNMAGHAYTNPAADCYLNVMGGATDGLGNPLTFNANTCYSSGNPLPLPPTNLSAVVQ